MNIFGFGKKKTEPVIENRNLPEDYNPVMGTLSFSGYGTYATSYALKLSTVFRCVNLISDSIASMKMIPYKSQSAGTWKSIDTESNLYNLLNVAPNPFMGAYTFKKLLLVNVLTKGQAFVLITRARNGKVTSLELMANERITVAFDGGDIKYIDAAKKATYDKSQVIHILNYTVDGFTGLSTLSYAADTLNIAYQSEQHTKNWFQGGATLSGILRPLAGVNISRDKAVAAKNSFMTALSSDLGGKSNSIVVLDSGLEYQPIQINPKDSQLLESRQFNVQDVCRFFNVPPSLAFSETGKFSTAEQQSLDFLNNTLTPIVEKLENEFFRKLYLPSEYIVSELKFDVDNLMRLDAVSRADYFTKMYQIGGYTTNEIREKLNSANPVTGGNRAMIQVNMQPLDSLITDPANRPQSTTP